MQKKQPKLNALLVGYGNMGSLIHKLSPQFNITICAICDHNFTKPTLAKKDGVARSSLLTQQLIDGCDVVIDFSHAAEILDRIALYCKHKIPAIIGTTGWQQEEEKAKKMIMKSKSAACVSSNFSIGMYLFKKLVGDAAKLMQLEPNYHASIVEVHHTKKKDSPSGTALMLAQCFAEDIPIASIRTGKNPGRHTIIFDAASDTIQLEHQAKNRDGFAKGALTACHFIQGRVGYFGIQDMVKIV